MTAALGPSKFQSEFEVGRRLSRDAASRLALREAVPATGSPVDDDGTGAVLGKREADVARLVAEGLSNSRAQIAGWMAASDR